MKPGISRAFFLLGRWRIGGGSIPHGGTKNTESHGEIVLKNYFYFLTKTLRAT